MTEPTDKSNPSLAPGKLNYQSGQAPPPEPTTPGRTLLWFFIGLLGGTALSAVVWIFAFRSMESPIAGGAVFAMPVLKLAAGITFVCLRGWRSLGAGILVSLAMGFLIFFGVCASHLSNMH